MGGQAGTEVEITITGENIEDASQLFFTHSNSDKPALTVARKLAADGKPEANKYLVSIAANCPPGLYETRVMTRLGVSSSRYFSVDRLPEVIQKSPNTSLTTAMELSINSISNAATTAKSVDYYRFQANKGQRLIVNCAARGIDSKLDPVVIIADAAGQDLQAERRGGILDFVVPSDGQYVIKVHDLTFKGGPAFFYRLSLQEISTQSPVPQFAATQTVSSFSWPPAGLAESPLSMESEPNNGPNQAKKITLPCDIAGNFFPAADVDTFEFDAHRGDVWWVEVASERLGRPTDPAVLIQRVVDSGKTLVDVAEYSDIPSPVKPSSNGYAYDGPPYNGGSSDILGKLEIKEDGLYRLTLSDLFGGTRNDSRNVYRLIVRKAAPDFALVAWGLHMELRNGDRNALSKPIALRAGATIALEVVAVRRDGFEGEIELVIEGLPGGVTAKGLTIAAGKSRGIMLITAEPGAPAALANATFYGRASVEGAQVIRPCRMAEMAWPVPDAWGEIPTPRLISGLPVSVTNAELAPLTIHAAEQKVWEATAGSSMTIPLKLTRRGEFSGSLLQLRTFGEGFQQKPQFDVPLSADHFDVALDLGALKTPPGDYVVAFYGGAVVKYKAVTSDSKMPPPAPRDTVDIVVSEPIAIRVKQAEPK